NAAAAALVLSDDERARLAERLPAGTRARPRRAATPRDGDGEVVMIMGIAGAGKSRAAEALTGRGYLRLNRDERGGTLRGLAQALGQALERGERRVVLDNTYLGRASRADVIEAAARHGLPVRCVFVDTPVPQAQVNLCLRLVDHFGTLPGPEEIRASKLPGIMGPMPLFRQARELEPPAADEGFAGIETVAFTRAPSPELLAGAVVPLEEMPVPPREPPTLALGWRPGRGAFSLEGDIAVCPHPAGPPVCWCRPPLPGAVVAWARRRGVDLARVTVLGGSPTFRALARAFTPPAG
ncbi:MAG TPA: AAA family ATPase, partial [Vicinamibacteria bacterium]